MLKRSGWCKSDLAPGNNPYFQSTTGNKKMVTAKKTGLSGQKTSSKGGKLSTSNVTKGSNIPQNLQMNFDVTANKLIPPAVSAMLQAQFKAVGVDFDPTTIKLTDQNFNQTIKKLKETAEIISNNVKLLPDMVKLCNSLSQGAKQLSNANREIVINTLHAQHGIDANQAEILLALAKFGKARNKIQEKLDSKLKMVTESDNARFAIRETSHAHQLNVLNQSSALLNEVMNRQLEGTKAKNQAKDKRNKASQEYVQVARV